jgi:putative transposase
VVYNPEKHKRKSIRLKEYDYSKNGAYFLTICTNKANLYFEQYIELKNIVEKEWSYLENSYSNIILDEFIIMPNHIHGIIFITGYVEKINNVFNENKNQDSVFGVGARPTRTLDDSIEKNNLNKSSYIKLGDVIGYFKSKCVVEWINFIKNNNLDIQGKFWHRNYYERIIRNEYELNKIREYIINNPIKWETDKLNPMISKRC